MIANSVTRYADEGIYLNEHRHREPKEIFKFIASLVKNDLKAADKSLLDVGCSTGEFLFYAKGQFPTLELNGIDVSSDMIERARQELPGANFTVHSALEPEFFAKNQFDIVCSSGVLCLFDDIEAPLRNIVNSLKPGGRAYLSTIMNDDPVDVILRYRDVRETNPRYQAGWNIFSKRTISDVLTSFNARLDFDFHDFRLPFAIPKRDDPMRTWTEKTESNPYQIVNGACQLVNNSIVRICRPS